jgi:hypothetical protein
MALLTLGVCVSVAAGGAPMGPPIAVLGEGQWSLGGEFAHEQIDLEGTGMFQSIYLLDPAEVFDFVEQQRLQDVEMNMFFATLAYGVCDNWDLFVRVGAADAQDDMSATADVIDYGIPGDYSLGTLDSSYGLAWGFGSRATFCRSGPWSFGGLAQITWFDPGDSDIEYADPIVPPVEGTLVQTGTASIDFWQTQVSLAVAYEMEAVRVWAGPFVQFLEGDFERSGSILIDGENFGDSFDASGDIREKSQFGGFVGASWKVADQWNLWGEGQLTGDSWLIGVGVTFLPETSEL